MRPPDPMPLAVAALFVSLCAAGTQVYLHVHDRNEKKAQQHKAPGYGFTCWSKSAWDGTGYTIYPNQPLEPQNCHRNQNWPGAILCERTVTLECRP